METQLTGVVTDKDANGLPSAQGLYLRTDDGKHVQLITGPMMQQMSLAAMWAQSRDEFAARLGERITVQGYLSYSQLYSAMPVEPGAG